MRRKTVSQWAAEQSARSGRPHVVRKVVSVLDGVVREKVDDGAAKADGAPGVNRQALLAMISKRDDDGQPIFYAAEEPFEVFSGRISVPVPVMDAAAKKKLEANLEARKAEHERLKAKLETQEIRQAENTAKAISNAINGAVADAVASKAKKAK